MTTAALRFKRFSQASKRRANWDETYRDAMKFCAQHRETFDYHTPGEKKYNRIFDSTATNAVLKFSSNIQSGMVPPFKKWAKLVPGSDIPQENFEEARKQLEDVTESFFKYLHSSNFDTQISEAFVDLAFGTGALLINEGNDRYPLNFIAVPLAELYLEEGPFGSVKTVFRKFTMPRRNIKATWKNATLPADWADSDSKDDDLIEILESTIYDPEEDKYEYSVDICKGKQQLLNETSDSSPWVVFRWATMPGEIYGRGPVLSALADIKTLNKVVEYLLKSAALKTIPTFVAADDGVINPYAIEIEPGAIIPAAPFGPGGSPIVPLQVGGDINLSQFIMDKMQARIEETMFTNQLGDVNLPVKSATELSLRQQELSKRIGSAFGRLHHECVSQIIERSLFVLDEKGLLPVRLKNIKINGKAIKISYQSPLAMAQGEEEMVNTMRYVQSLLQLYGPEIMPLLVPPGAYAQLLADNLSINSKIYPTSEQLQNVAALVDKLAAAAQQQAQPPAPPGTGGAINAQNTAAQ